MSNPSDEEIHSLVERVVKRFLESPSAQVAATPPASIPMPGAPKHDNSKKAVAIGSDHGGFELKEILKAEIGSLGFEVVDLGTNSREAVDYPDFAHAVAKQVASGAAWRGIVVDGAGIGSCIVANKVPGVRAGLAYDYASAVNSREHNDTNVLTLGAGLIGVNLAKQIVKVWLGTDFGGGRHAKRLQKILDIEKQYLK
jgi:ribose 5-phosphate isomerase B